MSDKCGIKILQKDAGSKAVIVVRKMTGHSLAEIKGRIAAGDPVVEFDQSDTDGWATIVQMGHALEAKGIATQAYLGAFPFPLSYFVNRLRSEKEDIIEEGREDMYEDEPWWNLDLDQFEE